MKRWINRLAWRIVRATAEPQPKRPRCWYCGKRHRKIAAYSHADVTFNYAALTNATDAQLNSLHGF